VPTKQIDHMRQFDKVHHVTMHDPTLSQNDRPHNGMIPLQGEEKMRIGIFARTGLALLACGSAQAQETTDWEVQITPYAWMSGLSGDLGTIPGLPASSVDLSFGDVLEDLDVAGMLMASARNGPWVILLDTTFVRTSSSEKLGGVVFDRVEIESETTNLALAVGRTIAQTPQSSVDAYLGARAWWLTNTFDLRGVGGGKSSRTERANWIDPLVGIAGRYSASDRWDLFGNAEVGGFGVGADLEWSVMAGATYSVTETFGVSVGWRYLAVDYDKDGIVYDVSQSGPVLGATFRF
jgi:hypothetical protein